MRDTCEFCTCTFCGRSTIEHGAHYHQRGYVCECCWTVKHTPEPWVAWPDGGITSNGVLVAQVEVENAEDSPGTVEADAKRIVACVNALKNIDDPIAFVRQAKIDSILVEAYRNKERRQDTALRRRGIRRRS